MKPLTNHLTMKLLSLYRGNTQNSRETLHHFMPIQWGSDKFCCATDGKQVIIIPENEKNRIEAPTAKTVDIVSILKVPNKNELIDIAQFRKKVDAVEVIDKPIMEECPSCEGNGKFSHFHNSYDCKYCPNSSGYIDSGFTEKGIDDKITFKIGDCLIRPAAIANVLRVFDMVEAKELRIRFQGTENQILMLSVDEIFILIGPNMEFEGDKIIEL